MSCASHVALAAHWPRVELAIARGQWADLQIEPDPSDDLVRYLHIHPRLGDRVLWHTFRFDMHTYPGQPPSVQCVHPITHAVPRANDTPWWPRSTSPVINLQPGTDPPYFCFPYTLEFLRTHAPLDPSHQHHWSVDTHTVYATVKMLRRLFLPAYYCGYFQPEIEEEIRAAVAAQPSPYAPKPPPPSADDPAA